MSTATSTAPISPARLWTGRVLSFLPAALLIMAASQSLMRTEQAVEGAKMMGYPESAVFGMGVALLVSVICYLIPQTSVVGAALLTGYLGGAVATHVHHGDPAFNVVLPVIFGMILWAGLVLREPRLEILLPWKR
jgi:hypothetical protein